MRFKPLDAPSRWGHIRMTIHAWLVVTLIFGSTVQPLLAADYYVNATTGLDSRTAAQAQDPNTPWQTITRALDANELITADQVFVAPGIYSEAIGEVFPLHFRSGIAILSSDPNTTIIEGNTLPLFHNRDVHGSLGTLTRLSQFTLRAALSTRGKGINPLVHFEPGLTFMGPEIDNNFFVGGFKDNPDVGILYEDDDPNNALFTPLIRDNRFNGFGTAGIFGFQNQGGALDDFSPTIRNNTFTNNSYGYLLSLTNTTTPSTVPSLETGRGFSFRSVQGRVAPQVEQNTFGMPGNGNVFDVAAYLYTVDTGEAGGLVFAPTLSNNTFTGSSSDSVSFYVGTTFISGTTFGADDLDLSPTIVNNNWGDPNDPNLVGAGNNAIRIDGSYMEHDVVSQIEITGNTISNVGNEGLNVHLINAPRATLCDLDWNVSNNTILNTDSDGMDVYVWGLCSDSKIPERGDRGAEPVSGVNFTLSNNTITATGGAGITASVSTLTSMEIDIDINDNVITDAGIYCGNSPDRGGCGFQDGITFSGENLANASATYDINDNEITRTSDQGIQNYVQPALGVTTAVSMVGNQIRDAGSIGCEQLPQQPTAQGDTVRGKGGFGNGITHGIYDFLDFAPRGQGPSGTATVTIANNTITDPAQDGISVSVSSMFDQNLGIGVDQNTISGAGACEPTIQTRGLGPIGYGIEFIVDGMVDVIGDLQITANRITDSFNAGLRVFLIHNASSNVDQSVLLQGNTITGNDGDGISLIAESHSGVALNDIQVIENVLQNNASDGLFITGNFYADNTNPILVSCNTITDNGENGVLLSPISSVPLNSVATPRGDFWPAPDFGGGNLNSPGQNIILDNATAAPPLALGLNYFQFNNDNDQPVSAENNYWGSTDTATIDAGIRDDDELATLGAVDFDPFQAAPVFDANVPLTVSVLTDIPPTGPSVGDNLRYTATIEPSGAQCNCANLIFTAPIPANTVLVSGSVQSSQGTVSSEEPIQVELGLYTGTPIVITWIVIPQSGTSVTSQGTFSCALQPPGQVSDDPNTPDVDDPTIVELGQLPTPTPTATATVTPTATATPTPPEEPLCSRADSCFLFEMMAADFSNLSQPSFTWRLTNNCAGTLTRVDFRFVPGATVLTPAQDAQYVAPGTGNAYTVDVVGGPNAGVAFVPEVGTVLGQGQSDRFTFTIAGGSLQQDAVLWNSATATGFSGRIDMRSQLCFQPPQTQTVLDATACLQPPISSQSTGWAVDVSWGIGPQAEIRDFQLFRVDASGHTVPLHAGLLSADDQGKVRFMDRGTDAQAAGYQIQPFTRAGEASGPVTQVDVSSCVRVVGSGSEGPQLLLFLALIALAAVSLPRYRRRLFGASR